MGRSQRHRLQLNGVVSRDIKGQTPSYGTYDGSNIRASAIAGAATRGRAGGALSNDGVGGAGTQDIAGYIGVAVSAATVGHVDGVTGSREYIKPGPSTPPITAFLPTASSQIAAGATGRTVYTLASATGGIAPFTLAIMANVDNLGIAVSAAGNSLVSTLNPIGTVAAHIVSLRARDNYGNSFTQNVTITLT